MKRLSYCLMVILCMTAPKIQSLAQVYKDDPSFQQITVKTHEGQISSLIKQPDGKILVVGGYHFVNDVYRKSPIRLNEDGTLDDTFEITEGGGNFKFLLRKDGKIIYFEWIKKTDGKFYINLTLYKQDGVLESSTLTDIQVTPSHTYALAVQDDNKVLVGISLEQENYTHRTIIRRINTDGTIDDSFNFDDEAFSSPRLIAIQANGKILIAGTYRTEGEREKNIIRLDPEGNLDTNFNPPLPSTVSNILFQKDDKILLATGRGIVRLHASGALDDTFTTLNVSVYAMALQANGMIMIGQKGLNWWNKDNSYVHRLNSDGTRDNSFYTGYGTPGGIGSIAVQNDGEILVGGNFSDYNAEKAIGIMRLEKTNGKIDPTFTLKLETKGKLEPVFVQPDGKYLVFGQFDTAYDQQNGGIVRCNEDGSIDHSFDVASGITVPWKYDWKYIKTVAMHKDNKILIGGNFNSFMGSEENSLTRLNEDGTKDQSFYKFPLKDFIVHTIAVQENGRILVGGEGPHGHKNKFVVRLLSNGTIDPDFIIGEGNYGSAKKILIQSDGKILVGGAFLNYNDQTVNNLIRLNSDGSIDESYKVPESIYKIHSMAYQPDGKLILADIFDIYFRQDPTYDIKRLNTDGSLDESFKADVSNIDFMDNFLVQKNGQLLISGSFQQESKKLTLLNNDGSINHNFAVPDFDNDNYIKMTQVDNKLLVSSDNNLFQLYRKKEQKITFNLISNKFTNTAPFAPEASASSGLPLTYTIISGPASTEGKYITLTGMAGKVIIQADQEGNDMYEQAESITMDFEVEEVTEDVDEVTGLDDIISKSLLIYPNPANGYILVESPFISRHSSIQFLDLKGLKVMNPITTTPSGYIINTSNLPQGIYLLQLHIENNKVNRKIIIQ